MAIWGGNRVLIRGDVDNRAVVQRAMAKAQALANKIGSVVYVDFMNYYGSGRGRKGFRAPWREVHPQAHNPAGIRAQVRRLPSGQIQLKIPLGRRQNPEGVVKELERVLGRKVKAVQMLVGKSNPRAVHTRGGNYAVGDFYIAKSGNSWAVMTREGRTLARAATKQAATKKANQFMKREVVIET